MLLFIRIKERSIMKLSRKQIQVNKANKVAKAEYKAARRSPIMEEVYMPPVRLKPTKQDPLRVLKLIKKDILTREAQKYFPQEKAAEIANKLLRYTAEYAIKDLDVSSIQEFILREMPLYYALRNRGIDKDVLLEAMEETPHEFWYRHPILQLYVYAYGCFPADVVELDHIHKAYKKVEHRFEVLDIYEWADKGFPSDPNFVNSLDYHWVNPGQPRRDPWDELGFLGRKMTYHKKNSKSIFDLLSNWEVLSSQELFKQTIKEGITPQDIIQWLSEGKHRMIRKVSRLDADVLTSNGIPVTGEDASNLARLLDTDKHKLNIKAAKKVLDFNNLDYDKLTQYIVLGEHGVNLPRSLHIADYAYKVDPIPEGMKKLVAINEQLINAVFSHGIPVDWSIHPSSARECVVGSVMIHKDLSRAQAEMWLQHPSIDEAIEYAKEHSPELDCTLPEVYFQEEGYTLTRLSKDALENLFMGELTSCCQKIGGAGAMVCKESWTDKYSVNYVVKSPSGNICAHFWAWEAKDGGVVIDSIEGRSSAPVEVIAKLTAQFVDKMNGENTPAYMSQTSYGVTEGVTTLIKKQFKLEEVVCPEEARGEEYSYKDAYDIVYKIN